MNCLQPELSGAHFLLGLKLWQKIAGTERGKAAQNKNWFAEAMYNESQTKNRSKI